MLHKVVRWPFLVALVLGGAALTVVGVTSPVLAQEGAAIYITGLSCTGDPETVTLRNFSDSAVSLAGYRLQSDPTDSAGQDEDLTAFGTLAPGASITFEAGPAANENVLHTASIYRNTGEQDWARLVRPDGSMQQVNCGQTPATPTATTTATVTATATPTATTTATATLTATTTAVPTTVTATPTTPVRTATTAVPTTVTGTPPTATPPPITTVPATSTTPAGAVTTAPRPPATGTGGDGASGPLNLWLAAAGALVIGGGLSLVARGKR